MPVQTNITSRILNVICHTLLFIALIACGKTEKTSQNKKLSMDEPISKEVENMNSENKNTDDKIILFFGNSLTAGYGLDESESFPSLIQNRLDSLELSYKVVNAGLSGETTAGGVGRIDWILGQKIDIFFLELGGNDMLRGLDIKETERNLRTIIQRVRTKNPNIPIILAGMQAPPNMGSDYADTFNNIYKSLSKEFNTGLIPFLLENVGGITTLNLPDGKHPNAEGQKIVRENVWKELRKVL